MLEIIPVLENLLFSAYRCWADWDWCRYLPVSPCNGCWPRDPGFLLGENPAWDPGMGWQPVGLNGERRRATVGQTDLVVRLVISVPS